MCICVFSNETSVGTTIPTLWRRVLLEKPQLIKKFNAAYGHECFHALNCMRIDRDNIKPDT